MKKTERHISFYAAESIFEIMTLHVLNELWKPEQAQESTWHMNILLMSPVKQWSGLFNTFHF